MKGAVKNSPFHLYRKKVHYEKQENIFYNPVVSNIDLGSIKLFFHVV